MNNTILNVEQLRRISVNRVKVSTTQGFALVCVDGKPVRGLEFGDDPVLHSDGKWYSDRKDFDFIRASLHHPHNRIYHLREKIIRELQKEA